jgi:hypothetical protein
MDSGADGVAAELDFPGEVAREDGTEVFRTTDVSTVREDLTAESTFDDDDEATSSAIDATGEEARSFAIKAVGEEARSATGKEAPLFAIDAPAPSAATLTADVTEMGSSDC